ncbi:MAG: hypothetical protein MKZ96_06335 [Candidatus Atelocyanobacterium sp. ALOHA_A2.5_9]|nr:hypothetical protein [Candidatus Atelocyanobacterium sp. ALOHA_A2.5_9]
MTTRVEQLEAALIQAHQAGDTDNAIILAQALKEEKNKITTETKKPLSTKEQLEDYAMSSGSGTFKGLSYIPGFVGDIEQLGNQFLPEFMTRPIGSYFDSSISKTPNQLFPTSQEIRNEAINLIPALQALETYQPKTSAGGYLQSIPEFAAPGLLGKTKTARKFGLGLGAGTGATYETLEQLTGSPGLSLGISLPAQLIASYLLGPSKAARLAENATSTVTKKQIDDAINLEATAANQGVKLLPGETVDNKFVKQLTEDVYQSDQGAPLIYDVIKDRPVAAQKLATDLADEIADVPESQREVIDLISDTAEKSVKSAKTSRRIQAQEAGYKVANNETITTTQAQNVIDNIDDLLDGPNTPIAPNSRNYNILKQIRNELVRKVDGNEIPVTNINQLDTVFKTYRDASKLSSKNVATDSQFMDANLRNILFNDDNTGALDVLVDTLNTNPSYKKANQVFEELSNTLVNVTTRNLDGLLKGNIKQGTIENFVFNPTMSNVNDINKTMQILAKQDPEAVRQIANVYFRNAINNAFPITVKQGEDLSQGFKLIEKIAGKGQQRANFMAMLDNVAEVNKVPKKEFKVGFEKMINILERTGRLNNINRPGFDVGGEAKRTLLKDVALAKTFNPLVRLATKYGEIQAGGAYQILGEVLSSDQAVANLIELGKTGANAKRQIRTVLNIINTISPATERFGPDNPDQSLLLENVQNILPD